MKMLGTQTDFSLGWIVNYLFNFKTQLSLEPDLPQPPPDSHDGSAESERTNRRRGDIGELEAEVYR